MSKPNKYKSPTNKKVDLEVWVTRHGVSIRVVERKRDGKFIDNMSVKQLVKIQENLDNAIGRDL